MIYRFIMLSDEVENFRREYRLDAEASFLDLHNIIIDSVGYKSGEMSSFFICDDDWSKETEITLLDMSTSTEVDPIIMEESILGDFLEEERQKLMFVFDHLSERAFFMELREIIFGENMDEAIISKSIGQAPVQVIIVEEEPVIVPKVIVTPPPSDDLGDDEEEDEIDDEFYGDDDYNEDELDADGFEDMDEDTNIDELEL